MHQKFGRIPTIALIFLGFILVACKKSEVPSNDSLTFPSSNRNIYLTVDCKIIDHSGNTIRAYPYDQCIFLETGRMLVEDQDASLSYIDENGTTIWKLDIKTHHMFNLSHDKKTILAIGSEDIVVDNTLFRMDVLYRIDWSGKILSKWKVSENFPLLNQLIGLETKNTGTGWFGRSKAKREISHANSIYEIPPNSLEKKLPAFSAGNVIVNLNTMHSKLIILDPDLKKILMVSKPISYVHDAQVLSTGDILLFRNWYHSEKENSQIEYLDPEEQTVRLAISGDEKFNFQSELFGSVQKLADNRYLISFNDRKRNGPQKCEAHILNKNGSSIWNYVNSSPRAKLNRCPSIQRAKIADLDAFLANNKY
jgi:hypothetical protein